MKQAQHSQAVWASAGSTNPKRDNGYQEGGYQRSLLTKAFFFRLFQTLEMLPDRMDQILIATPVISQMSLSQCKSMGKLFLGPIYICFYGSNDRDVCVMLLGPSNSLVLDVSRCCCVSLMLNWPFRDGSNRKSADPTGSRVGPGSDLQNKTDQMQVSGWCFDTSWYLAYSPTSEALLM